MVNDGRGRVMAMALLAIEHAMNDGAEHGYVDDWTRQSIHVHRAHAADHLAADIHGDDSEAHLEHAICRLAMAMVRRSEDK